MERELPLWTGMERVGTPALRQAVAAVTPSRLPEFFQEIQDAFTQAGDAQVHDLSFVMRRTLLIGCYRP
jgi:hypothetical protein